MRTRHTWRPDDPTVGEHNRRCVSDWSMRLRAGSLSSLTTRRSSCASCAKAGLRDDRRAGYGVRYRCTTAVLAVLDVPCCDPYRSRSDRARLRNSCSRRRHPLPVSWARTRRPLGDARLSARRPSQWFGV